MTDDVWTVERHMLAGNEQTVAIYRKIEEVVHSLGEISVSVSKTAITFKGPRRGFAGARPNRDGVVGYFDLMRQLPADPRIRRVSPYGRNLFVHGYRLRDEFELDATFVDWLTEAYQVGSGAHLQR